MILASAAAAFLLSTLITPVIRALGRRAGVIDVPNERSSHHVPTPRGGGIAILLGTFVGAGMTGVLVERFWALAVAATIVIAITGFIDDVRSLGAGIRFLFHCAAALLPLLFGRLMLQNIVLPWGDTVTFAVLALPLTLFFIVGLTNAYNFMDGINGIAALEAIIASGALAALFFQRGDVAGALVAGSLAGAAAGFLPWNFPSASIFMGDVGSGAIGFLLALLVLRYGVEGGDVIPALLPLLPFILDTAVTLVRRIARGERFYAAHRSHFYQRLNALGWSHAGVSTLWAMLAGAGGVIALFYSRMAFAHRAAAVAVLLIAHVAVAFAITHAESRRAQQTS